MICTFVGRFASRREALPGGGGGAGTNAGGSVGTTGIERGDKNGLTSSQRNLKRALRVWEFGCIGIAGKIGIIVGVERNCRPETAARGPAKVCGINERCPIGAELRGECVCNAIGRADVCRLEGARGGGETR